VTGSADWAVVFREVGIGLGVLLAGIGFLYASIQLGATLRRLGTTLDLVDRQVSQLGVPMAKTLDRVSGIAATADDTLARATRAVSGLERVSATLASGVELVGSALRPPVVNMAAALNGVTAGLRRLVRGEERR
jgi:hypothetical protein